MRNLGRAGGEEAKAYSGGKLFFGAIFDGGNWLARICAGLTLVLLLTGNVAAESPKRILILNSFGQNFSPFDMFEAQLRTDLVEQSPGPLDIYEVSIETARFTDGNEASPLVDYILALFAQRRPELVITIGGPAARFVQRFRQRLFSTTPLIYTGLDERAVDPTLLTSNDTVVAVRTDVTGVLLNIMRVLPKTKTLAVVLGTTPLERFWMDQVRQAAKPFADKLNLVALNELPYDEILKRVARLPPDSAVLLGPFWVDVQGIPHLQDQALSSIHAAANAPIFGVYEFQLGNGILGGPLLPMRRLSLEMSGVAIRILGGETPGNIKTPPMLMNKPAYDWRELQRWHVNMVDLPPESSIEFQEATVWDQYKWYLIAGFLVCAGEALLIIGLLVNRRLLHRTRDDLAGSEGRMSLAASAANLRFWIWEIARDEVWTSTGSWHSKDRRESPPVSFESFAQAVHPDDRLAMLEAVRHAVDANAEYRAEYRVMLADSTIRWVAERGRVESDKSGGNRLLAISIDVTERRKAEDAARDLSGRLITAQEEERARLARAMHDDITQRLAVLAIEAMRSEVSMEDDKDRAAMHSVRDSLVHIGEDVHALAYALHPAILEDLGLVEALRIECDRFSGLESIPVEATMNNVDGTIPRDAALCLFRIAQEALRNVARHAHAASVDLTLRPLDDGLQLSISDNGIGYDPARLRGAPSLGHASMRERVKLLGGELHIESSPGQGTTVLAWVPLAEGEQRESSTHLAG